MSADEHSDELMAPVSMATVARAVGVSINTVSLALRQSPRISAATQKRVMEAAAELGYTRNPIVGRLLTELRRMRTQGFRHTLALLSAHPDPDAFRTHVMYPRYIEGIERRAADSGYRFDRFSLSEPGMNPTSLSRILDARGIRGALCLGLWPQTGLLESYRELWTRTAFVSVAVPTVRQGVSCVAPDHFMITQRAVREARRRGYQRPGLFIRERVDRIVDKRYSAGFAVELRDLPQKRRVPWLRHPTTEGPEELPPEFGKWMTEHQPDLIITYNTHVWSWLELLGKRVPEDVGIVLIDRMPGCEHWAHFDQRNERLGELGADFLATLLDRGETGTDDTAHEIVVPSKWCDGVSVRPRVADTAEAVKA